VTVRTAYALLATALLGTACWASKIDLSTVPPREGVEVIIYRDVDLTLVREQRAIRFHKGENEVAFSWADTNIDPTSVRIRIAGDGAGYALTQTTYPPEQPNTLVWHITAPKDGSAPLEVTYFTRGLTWSASYTLILSQDEKSATLAADFSIGNQSGEDYENAKVALLTGGVQLVEQVVALEGETGAADRAVAYFGMPATAGTLAAGLPAEAAAPPAPGMMMGGMAGGGGGGPFANHAAAGEVAIAAANVSEHERYALDTQLALQNGWVTRLRFTESSKVAPKVLARFTLFGDAVPTRIVKVKNDKDHGLGGSALPQGPITLFKRDPAGRLIYLGESGMPYAGVGQEVEVVAGQLPDVVVKPEQMATRKRDITFDDRNGVITGKVVESDYRVEATNRDQIARTLELIQMRPGNPNVFKGPDLGKKQADRITWEFPLDAGAGAVLEHSFHEYLGIAVNNMPKEGQ
jgi:hypothetical protein